jgi:histidinol-phosphate aminotransferase
VAPENVVLGAGADDLILLSARAFAGPGDVVAIDVEPTYPLFRIAAQLAGADVGAVKPAVTFACRPNNPTGTFGPLPMARPLVVDEAYFEYAGETAAGLIGEGVVVLRTFSKAFGLAGARVGYALADRETAAELNRRQAPQPISGISAALALAALAEPPEVGEQVAERDRCAVVLSELGFRPPPSRANFLFVPLESPEELGAALFREGLVVRVFPDGIRFSIRDREDDDRLLDALVRRS